MDQADRQLLQQTVCEFGQSHSSAFDKLCDYLTRSQKVTPFLIAEVATMLRASSLAQAWSYRQTRARALWGLLRYAPEDSLIEALGGLSDWHLGQPYILSAIAAHPSAGTRLWGACLKRAQAEEARLAVHEAIVRRDAARPAAHASLRTYP